MAKLYKLEAKFGTVSFGDKIASVGVHVPIGEITLTKAHKDICECRLTGQIVAKGSPDDDANQGTLAGMEDDVTIKGTFDVASISVSSKQYGFPLSFKLKDMHEGELTKIAKRSGHIVINKTEEAPDEPKPAKKKDDEEESEE